MAQFIAFMNQDGTWTSLPVDSPGVQMLRSAGRKESAVFEAPDIATAQRIADAGSFSSRGAPQQAGPGGQTLPAWKEGDVRPDGRGGYERFAQGYWVPSDQHGNPVSSTPPAQPPAVTPLREPPPAAPPTMQPSPRPVQGDFDAILGRLSRGDLDYGRAQSMLADLFGRMGAPDPTGTAADHLLNHGFTAPNVSGAGNRANAGHGFAGQPNLGNTFSVDPRFTGQDYGPSVASPEERSLALELQEMSNPKAVYHRYFLEHGGGNLAPDVRAFLASQADDQYARYRLQLGIDPLQQGQTFYDYLGRRGGSNAADIVQQLRSLTSQFAQPGGANEPVGAFASRMFYENPKNAFEASLQPGLLNVAPSVRGLYESAAQRLYNDWRAQQPQDQGRFLQYAQSRGLF